MFRLVFFVCLLKVKKKKKNDLKKKKELLTYFLMIPSLNQYKPHLPSIPIPSEPSARPFRRQTIIRTSNGENPKTARLLPILPSMPPSDHNPRFRVKQAIQIDPNTNNSIRSTRVSINKLPQTPLSPQEAINKYGSCLTNVERAEILQFPEIYYLGGAASASGQKVLNANFDDATHHYKVVIGDHLAYRYEILSILGQGAFGQVVKCYDHKQKIVVAVKIIISTQQMVDQAAVEASSLAKLNKLDTQHFVKAYDYFLFRNHPCITFECLSHNLKGTNLQQNQSEAKLIIHQLFSSLVTMKRCGIIHCDIKPENLLFSDNHHVKLIDFGTCCQNGKQKYFYIQSRHYRAPEVILACGYSFPIDIWSAALVAIEIVTGKTLFPGNNEQEMIKLFIEVLRLPPLHMLRSSRKFTQFFDSKCKPRFDVTPGKYNLQQLLQPIDPLLFDLISRCLKWDPNERISPEELMSHPYFKGISVPSNLPELRTSF